MNIKHKEKLVNINYLAALEKDRKRLHRIDSNSACPECGSTLHIHRVECVYLLIRTLAAEWAKDDRLWNTQEMVTHSLGKFGRTVVNALSRRDAPAVAPAPSTQVEALSPGETSRELQRKGHEVIARIAEMEGK